MVDAPVMLKEVPLPNEVAPQEEEYHCQVAPVPKVPPISVRVTVVPGHTVKDGLPVTEVGSEDKLFSVTVTV